jgi:MFS family permease
LRGETPKTTRGPGQLGAVREILRSRNFRLLWTGEGISLVGDQFYLVALPWLVLRLTGSALAIGGVLALVAIPRALFMLPGGALTDRFSPRVVMLGSNLGRLAMVATLATLTLAGVIQLWMIYVFALFFGLADAFFFPAQSSIVPRLIGRDRLQTGNAIIQGTAQLSMFVGPALAGVLIATLAGGTGVAAIHDVRGIGWAFALDALSFLASIAALAAMRLDRPPDFVAEKTTVLSSIAEELAVIWRDRVLRYYFVLIAAVTFFITGPFSVGVPVLAHTRYSEGATAFGIILSAYGGGSLLGVAVAGLSGRPSARRFPALMLGLPALMGVSMMLLGVMPALAPAAVVSSVMGLAQGYLVIQFITWLQERTPPRLLGRTMSLLMFAVVGLAPLSNAFAGALIQVSVTAVLLGAGIVIVGVVGVAALSPSVWRLGTSSRVEGRCPPTPASDAGFSALGEAHSDAALGRTAPCDQQP